MKAFNLFKNQFVTGSFIMLIGSNFYNLGQFIYHFLAGRFLGKALYGDLASLISIMTYFGIIQLALGLTIVKFISSQKNKKKLVNYVKWFHFWGIILGVFLALIILLLSPFLSKFLNLQEARSVYLLPAVIFFFSIVYVHRSILQGLLKFERLVLSLMVESSTKIVLTLIFIMLGFAVFGTIGAILISVLLAFLITKNSLAFYLKGKGGEKPQIKPLIKYSLPVFLQGIALNSMYSTDLVLVKHFFTAQEAGIYSSLSVLGRIVFFASSPIIQVMFPYISSRFARGEPFHKIFYYSFFLTIFASSFILLIFIFYPKLVISILFGSQFTEGSPMLFLFGLFMALLGLNTLLIQYFLSINRLKVVILFVGAAFLQAVLIWFIHPNIETVIKMSILSSALLLALLFVYFAYVTFSHRSRLQTR